jgi:hypothetical protein
MSKVALPGLTSAKPPKMTEVSEDTLPKGKNPFLTTLTWTPELMKQIEVVISDLTETTSDFTRKRNPKNRYWKAKVSFKHGSYTSQIIKIGGCEVPYMKATNYGKDYFIASLQKPIADAIIASAMQKEIIVTKNDPKIHCPDNEWWATINGIAGRTGIVDGAGNFVTRDLDLILQKTEQGVLVNLDLVLTIRLTTTDGSERSSKSPFRIVPDCSRAAIKELRRDVQPPQVESQIPQQQAARGDVASQDLIDALDALLL